MDRACVLTRRIRLSRWMNRRLGGADEMLCARAHREEWRLFCLIVDGVFIVWKLQVHRHCEKMLRWEELHGRKYPSQNNSG